MLGALLLTQPFGLFHGVVAPVRPQRLAGRHFACTRHAATQTRCGRAHRAGRSAPPRARARLPRARPQPSAPRDASRGQFSWPCSTCRGEGDGAGPARAAHSRMSGSNVYTPTPTAPTPKMSFNMSAMGAVVRERGSGRVKPPHWSGPPLPSATMAQPKLGEVVKGILGRLTSWNLQARLTSVLARPRPPLPCPHVPGRQGRHHTQARLPLPVARLAPAAAHPGTRRAFRFALVRRRSRA